MIASHSSSFMRSSRLSRVMPALLTRIAIAPKRASIVGERRVGRGGVGDVEPHARARDGRPPRAYAPIARGARRRWSRCRPPSRRRARARSAIARPMPRVAPVTSATCPSSSFAIASSASAQLRERVVDRMRRRSARTASSVVVDALAREPGEHLARARIRRRASRRARRSPAPSRSSAPGSPPGARARRGSRRASRCSRDVDVVHHRDRRRARTRPSRASRRAAPPPACSSELWNGADTGSSTPRLRAALPWPASIARSTAALWPAITSWPGALKLTGLDDLRPARPRAQASTTAASSPPRIAAIAPTPAGTASCIACARKRTSGTASRNASAPAATSAVYSPRL